MQLYEWGISENVKLQFLGLALEILFQLLKNGCDLKDSTDRLTQNKYIHTYIHTYMHLVFSMKKLLSIVPVFTSKYLWSAKNIVQTLVVFFHDFSYPWHFQE